MTSRRRKRDHAGRSDAVPTDSQFLLILDTELSRAARLAGDRLACRPGCTECCIGPFPVDALDARRLQAGLLELERRDPERAEAIRARARLDVARYRREFPGDPGTGALTTNGKAVDRFLEKYSDRPCPVLDPATGACELYDARPVVCRLYGLPARIGKDNLPPCHLCFEGSTKKEIDACRTHPDPDNVQLAILDEMEKAEAARGSRGPRGRSNSVAGVGASAETLIAFAITRSSSRRGGGIA